ncbi:hypothetical protein GRAN_1021 [Granulicella sibirica]|uniref:Uncharacterized protein n=2 Tax=Granulicella sibirica TaxID=2479048 RepID=A0A4Q0T7X8_9BACT|nr:hypothetical protein GRAN_1021 [Granulicella sibirica]
MRNKTNHPLILYLGLNVGGKDYAGEIKFSLTDVNGRVHHLVKRDPAYIAGRMGAYSVTLPVGGTFELPAIDLEDYWSYEPKIAALELPAGRYSLSAEYTGHNPNDDFTIEKGKPPFHEIFWIGTVHSGTLQFELALPMSYKDKR